MILYENNTGDATSTNGEITITDGQDYPVKELKLSKLSTQDTTTGKNLCEPTAYPCTASATYIQFSSTSPINSPYTTANTYRGVGFVAKVEANKTYTFSSDLTGSNIYVIGIYGAREDVTDRTKILEKFEGTTFTPTQSGYAIIGGIASASGTSMSWTWQQLELGSTPTSFEPYTNGPSPNPDYPQEVNTVKGYRNLFDISNVETGYGNVVFDVTGNVLTLEATGTTGAQYVKTFVKNVDSSKNYNFSFKAKKIVKGTDGQPTIRIVTYGSNDDVSYSFLGNVGNDSPVQGTEYSLNKVLTGYKYYRFYIYNNTYTPVSIGEKTQYYDISLIEGTQNLPYVPYGNNWICEKIIGKNFANLANKNDITSQTVLGYVNLDAGTYTVSSLIKNNSSISVAIRIFDSANNNLGTTNYIEANATSLAKKSITLSSNERIRIVALGSATGYNCDVSNIQVEKGETATTYEPYQERISTIPLNDNEIVGKSINLDKYIIDKYGHCYLSKIFNKIDSYNGETITTDYWSTTGGLDTGATIYYVAETPELIDLNYNVNIELFEGVNYISNSENADMSLIYVRHIDFTKNGLGYLNNVIDAHITEELNGEYSLTFDYPLNEPLSNELIEERIVKCNVSDSTEQCFIIKNVVKTYEKMTISCVHLFYLLLTDLAEDIYPQNLSPKAFLDWILARANYKLPFTTSTDVSDTKTARYVRKNLVEVIMGNINNSMTNLFGIEIERNNWNIGLKARLGADKGEKLIYGKNITGINVTLDSSGVYTRIMPIGFDGLMLPEKYVDATNINDYSYPKIAIFEFSNIKYDPNDPNAYQTLEDAYQALRDAVQELYDNGINNPKVNMKIDWLELSKTEEYKQYSSLERVALGDTIHAEIFGLDYTTRVIKTIYNPLNNMIEQFEIGTFKPSYSSQMNKYEIELNEMPESLLAEAQTNATNLITNAMGGYVYKTNEELYIMDNADPNQAQKVWRWNINGLGYSNTGVNGTYELAMTMDGSFVADFITTGSLSTERISGFNEIVIGIENQIDNVSRNIDENGNITEVTTTTGFTFNASGLHIGGDGFEAQHTATGTYYKDGNSITGQYTKDGSKQKDLELFGTYSYGKENINDTPMFVAQLYTDGNGEVGFGHFYNGGD